MKYVPKKNITFKVFVAVLALFIFHLASRRTITPPMSQEELAYYQAVTSGKIKLQPENGAAAPKVDHSDTKQVSSFEESIRTQIKSQQPSEVTAAKTSQVQKRPVRELKRHFAGPLYADLRTNLGVITIRLSPEIAPRTVESFVSLATGEKPWKSPASGQWVQSKFYDGLTFHRIVSGYFIQTGAPMNLESVNPGFTVPDEYNTRGSEILPGMVIMAQNGNGTAGSQFFIALSEMPGMLGPHNTVFGNVVGGFEVLKKLENVKTDVFNYPKTPAKILQVNIREVPTQLRVGQKTKEHIRRDQREKNIAVAEYY